MASRVGKIDATLGAMRSNDAGNVFGFKVQSREATFGDFGFAEFDSSNPNILSVAPHDLNYPDAKKSLSYLIYIFCSIVHRGQITQYSRIAHDMYEMSKIDKDKVVARKVFETKKTFYDITLLKTIFRICLK